MIGGPSKRGAKIGQFDGEPVVGLTLAGAVPQRHDVGFALREVAGMRGTDPVCLAARDELLLGELADRLQHREPGSSRGPVGDEQRLAHQGVEQIEDGVVIDIIGSRYRASTLEIESTGEHRTPIQQRLLRIVEQVVGPRHRVAQRLVTFQSSS